MQVPEGQEEPAPSVNGDLECELCGATYSLDNGMLKGQVPKGGLKGMMGNFVGNSNTGTNTGVYEVRTDAKGKVFMAMGFLD